jgi:FAD/FMN-containing dehydrogenase/Fe-S oxidoreductase
MRNFYDVQRDALVRHLQSATSGEVQASPTSRQLYSTDASIYQIEPLAVFLPRTTDDLRIAMQICHEHHIAIVPRGGGTSLSGQAIGSGLVVDCSKYLRTIVELDPTEQRARVQPGVVLEQLNQAAGEFGLMFGPDVSTANRATIAGMIGNNSAGSHSIVHGLTVDHVIALQVVFSDGSSTHLQREKLETILQLQSNSKMASLYQVIRQILQQHHEQIRQRFPKILRRVSGYNLDRLLKAWESGELNLAELITGSEGTLALIQEAHVKLVKKPRFRGLLVPHFSSIQAALESLETCLAIQPSAVELMDEMILGLARQNLALQRRMELIEGTPAALFMVEVAGDDPVELGSKLDKLERQLRGKPGVTALVRTLDETQREPLWRLRESGLPLLMGLPGDRKPVTFVEDTAVSPERLPGFVAAFQQIMTEHGTHGAIYGHASVGCLHIRPVLDLHQHSDVQTMRKISTAVTELVMQYEGSLSGEHGDGLARSEWLPKLFGNDIYQAFRQIKQVADPDGLMNPGKIVDAPPMDQQLRYQQRERMALPTVMMDYSKQGGITQHVELCSGTGVCRKTSSGTMCPSYRVTLDEAESTRGRANVLRLAFQQMSPEEALASPAVHEVLDLCLSCKACKAECPSNVDMAKLKAEATHQYYQQHWRPMVHRLQRHLPQVLGWGAWLAPMTNALSRWRFPRWLMQKWFGISQQRSLPVLHRQHFRRWFKQRYLHTPKQADHRLMLFDDCFTTYMEPHIGQAACKLLNSLGYQVELAGSFCCGRVLISQGYLSDARKLVEKQAPLLAARLNDDMPLLGLEPSCLLTLTDEWPELFPGEATKLIARQAKLAEQWLSSKNIIYRPLGLQAIVHGHCHQKALVGMSSTMTALRQIPQLQVKELDTGCCGMAGFFGYESRHFDFSKKIASQSLLPAVVAHPDAIVIASGTSCRHQLLDFATCQPLHPIELLAQQRELCEPS